MLADAGDDDGVASGDPGDLLHDVLRLDGAVVVLVVCQRELLLPRPHGGEPRRVVGGGPGVERLLERAVELGDDDLGVADDRHVGVADLADLGGVDVDVDHLGVRGEGIDPPGDAIVEARPEGHEEVGALHRRDRGVGAVHAGHAQHERVPVREGATGHEGRHDGCIQALGEGEELGMGLRLDDATPDVEHRPLGRQQQLDRGLHLPRMPFLRGVVPGQDRLDRAVPGDRRVEDVLGDVDQHRTRPAGRRDVERLVDHVGDLARIRDQVVVLRGRHRDAPRVGLLEGVHADRRRRDLTGDRNDRDRVHVGIRERSDEVRGSRPGGGERDADASGRLGVSLGHVPGALLMTGEDVPDRAVEDRVVGRHDRPAGDTEHDVDALELEGLDHGSGDGHLLGHGITFGYEKTSADAGEVEAHAYVARALASKYEDGRRDGVHVHGPAVSPGASRRSSFCPAL